MPKPFGEYPGSAMHTHLSLFEGEVNAFHSPDDPLQLSDVAKSFIAGILEHASEISAVTNQWVNSYKRLVLGGEAPTAASWGRGQPVGPGPHPDVQPEQDLVATHRGTQPRLGLQSVPGFRRVVGGRAARRREGVRSGSAGRGQTSGISPPRNGGRWVYRELPSSLDEALRAMESSELVAEALGEHVFDFFPAQQARRVGELPPSRHPLRAENLSFAVAGVGGAPQTPCRSALPSRA